MKFNIKKTKDTKNEKDVKEIKNAKLPVIQKIPSTDPAKTVKMDVDVYDEPAKLGSFMTISKLEYTDYPVYSAIMNDPDAAGGKKFVVIEPTFTEKDNHNFEIIRRILMTELTVDLNDIKSKKDAEKKLKKKILSIIKDYELDILPKSIPKIFYHAIRDFIYNGKIEAMLNDPMIEEISCDGMNIPLYIWHREYESMPSNIIFTSHRELDNFVRKIAYVSGKHISVAQPIVDASLPNGDRVNLTLGTEITKRGSTFTIRRFRADPITVIDLIKFGTLSADIAAYLWYLVEHKSTMLVAGGTASGKTTLLNTISSFSPPQHKIITIEDTQELNLPHENWIPTVSRQTFTGSTISEITQFDLLRAALRQRPDIIVVGETRGKEAYTLFQAFATGHGGFSSIHADSVAATINRLTSSPMDIPKVLITYTLDAIILQLKLNIQGRSVRRVLQISEIAGIDNDTGEILLNDVFNWDPVNDKHVFSGRSVLFEKYGQRYGESTDQTMYELNKRKTAIEWMGKNNIHKHKDVTNTIMEFYSNPERFYERKRMTL